MEEQGKARWESTGGEALGVFAPAWSRAAAHGQFGLRCVGTAVRLLRPTVVVPARAHQSLPAPARAYWRLLASICAY